VPGAIALGQTKKEGRMYALEAGQEVLAVRPEMALLGILNGATDESS